MLFRSLISDASLGKIYHYYGGVLSQTITHGTSFGSAIAYSDDIYIVSEPDSDTLYIYQLQSGNTPSRLTTYQTITSLPVDAVAISGDKRWIYTSDTTNNIVYAYKQSHQLVNATSMVSGQTYVINSVGTTDFTLYGAESNTVGLAFVYNEIGRAHV